MKSMTGYGKGVVESKNFRITIEIKTVNHKLFDLSLKLPRKIISFEETVRKVIKSKINRGHIDVFCQFEDLRENEGITLDFNLINAYVNLSKELNEKFNLYNDYSTSKVLNNSEFFKSDNIDVYEKEIKKIVSRATLIACNHLNKMREKEGKNLESVLNTYIENIGIIVNKIRSYSPIVLKDYQNRLEQTMKKYLAETPINETMLLNEVAIYSDRINVDEELNRLDSHLKSYYDYTKLNEPIGKKLDFLVQEINRELNTTGSKSNNYELTKLVIEGKSELEKFREQVQNIE